MALRHQIPEHMKHPTPLYAVVGAGDLVVERIRRADVEGEAQSLQTRASERLDAVLSEVLALPGQFRGLPDKAQAGVQSAVDQASETYDALAKRGEDLVARIRRQQSTQDLQKQTKSTVSQAKGTATTAKKSARSTTSTARSSAKKAAASTTSSAQGTAGSAKKAAKATSTRAKATTTSAQHTAQAAGQAAKDAAEKVGD